MIDLEKVNEYATAHGLGHWVRVDNTNAEKFADNAGAQLFAQPDRVETMCANHPVYMFVEQSTDDCAVCVTASDSEGLHITNIMGRESGRTVQPMFAPVVLSFVNNDEKHMGKYMKDIKDRALAGGALSAQDKLILSNCYPQFTEVAKELHAAKQKDEQFAQYLGGLGAGVSAAISSAAGARGTANTEVKPEEKQEKPDEKKKPSEKQKKASNKEKIKDETKTENDKETKTDDFEAEVTQKNARIEKLMAEMPALAAIMKTIAPLNVSTIELILECMENEVMVENGKTAMRIEDFINESIIDRIEEIQSGDAPVEMGAVASAKYNNLRKKLKKEQDKDQAKLRDLEPKKLPEPKTKEDEKVNG